MLSLKAFSLKTLKAFFNGLLASWILFGRKINKILIPYQFFESISYFSLEDFKMDFLFQWSRLPVDVIWCGTISEYYTSEARKTLKLMSLYYRVCSIIISLMILSPHFPYSFSLWLLWFWYWTYWTVLPISLSFPS